MNLNITYNRAVKNKNWHLYHRQLCTNTIFYFASHTLVTVIAGETATVSMRGSLGMLFSAMMSAGILATSLLGWLVNKKYKKKNLHSALFLTENNKRKAQSLLTCGLLPCHYAVTPLVSMVVPIILISYHCPQTHTCIYIFIDTLDTFAKET